MRKLYALLAGLCFVLTAVPAHAQQTTDVANFTFAVDAPNNNVIFTNTSTLGIEPGVRRTFWSFGDGSGQWTLPLAGTEHHYQSAGTYQVCLKIYRYRSNTNDSILSAQVCKTVTIEALCRADFERLPVTTTNNPLQATFKALPAHNNNKRPVRICWKFGDGRDTCIQYSNTNPGPYLINHTYANPGIYEVCVNILYEGGCEARKCKPVQIGRPDSCRADFERIPLSISNNPLTVIYKALPWHNNNKKPKTICWKFGDGTDTCINYPNIYNGLYTVPHTYSEPGLYEVCVKILYSGGCEARKCKPVQAGRPDSCRVDYERIPITTSNNPLTIAFRALPWHNNNKKPKTICWKFDDGTDTCISYGEDYNGQYIVGHRYQQPGQYEVCVKILYYGGCEARKCKQITIPHNRCDVRLLEVTPSVTSHVRGFYASLTSVPPSRPERICWSFGDGTDTCIVATATDPPDLLIRHTYPGPGVYRACVRVLFANGCRADDCKEVVIRGNNSICGGYMIDSLTAPRTYRFKGFSINSPNDQVISYRWSFGDGTTALGREVSHTYTYGGDFEVCLTIKTALGCETRICRKVRVPGNNQPALQLSPNPAINVLHALFFSTHTETVVIKLVNSNGVVIRTVTRNAIVGSNNWDFDVANLLPGVYSLVVQSPNQLASALFLKQ